MIKMNRKLRAEKIKAWVDFLQWSIIATIVLNNRETEIQMVKIRNERENITHIT